MTAEQSCKTCANVEVATDDSWACRKRINVDCEIDTPNECSQWKPKEAAPADFPLPKHVHDVINEAAESVDWHANYTLMEANCLEAMGKKQEWEAKYLNQKAINDEWVDTSARLTFEKEEWVAKYHAQEAANQIHQRNNEILRDENSHLSALIIKLKCQIADLMMEQADE